MRARLAEIQARLGGFNANENFSAEDLTEINALNDEFENLNKQIEARVAIESINRVANTSTRQVAATATPTPSATPVKNTKFQNSGEFFQAIRRAASNDVDTRLKAEGAFERTAEDGGFLIPTDFRTEIQNKVTGDESLLSRTFQIKTSSNHISIPVNEVAPWDGTGIVAFWEGEGQPMSESKNRFGQFNSKLHKLTALVRVTDELLEDAPALESFVRAQAPQAMLHQVNSAIISGNGAGKPEGFLNSGFKYAVSKESGQASETILFENIVNMQARILPMSYAKSVWLVNPAVMPQLRLMKFDKDATSPVPAYMPPSGLAEAPYGTLMGRPIMPMMGGSKALGTEGDISLVDLSYYISAYKTSGIKSDVSTHVHFDTNETAFRFVMRIAGGCPYKTPVTTENGDYKMSGIVTLEDR